MYIHLPGIHYYVKLFHQKAFCLSAQNNVFQLCPYFVFFWAVSRQYVAASLTSPACLYHSELYLDRFFQVYQQGFFSVSRSF